MKKYFFFLILLSLITSPSYSGSFVNYDAPESIIPAPEFQLFVNGEPVFVYNTASAAFAIFSFEGRIDLEVKFASPIYNFAIRPAKLGVEAQAYRNSLNFTLENACNISVELNENIKRPLFIFANPVEKEIPDKNDRTVLYFEGGKIHEPGEVRIKSNQIVYIEGGAVVRGHFIADQAENIKICGRGIIDNSLYTRGEFRPVEINRCKKAVIEGIVIADSKHWTCASFASEKVSYLNMKVVSANDWDDGIDIVGSHDILIDGCFIRSKDDCIAIKSGINYYTSFNSSYNVWNVLIQNSVFWNGIWGNGLEIGFETRTDTIRDIIFRNCDLIHVEGPEGTFTIHNGDRAIVTNVLYENIRVEDSRGWLIDFRILESRYSKDKQRGRIENIRFRNIVVEGDFYPPSQILGFDAEHAIKGIVLENVKIHGERINSTYNGMMAINHVDSLVFE